MNCVAIWRQILFGKHWLASIYFRKTYGFQSDLRLCTIFALVPFTSIPMGGSLIFVRDKPLSGGLENDVVEDFYQFCQSFDVRAVITADDNDGFEKEVYALAILRALHNGDFGADRDTTKRAIYSIWTRGYRYGFNADTFKEAFQEHFVC